jgi:protease-4
VGVFAGKFDIATLLERLGVRTEILTRGRNAGLPAASRPFTETERAALEAEVEETYQAFLETVATSRNMSREEAHRRGEGRVYSGAAAVEARLADKVGSFDAACRRALELAGAHPKLFDLLAHSTSPRRASFLSAFQQFGRAQVYALWSPWLRLDGLDRP